MDEETEAERGSVICPSSHGARALVLPRLPLTASFPPFNIRILPFQTSL